ncbi:30S ribosomal protein S27ae [Candidatus Woesearchaeota archaeon]|nr:30S ribosomal protein S27ae [Candidatus Woesearchaeota archaeon]
MAEKSKKPKATNIPYVSKMYKVTGGKLERSTKSCPKCGQGTFMANHKNRSTCGKCGYMEKK